MTCCAPMMSRRLLCYSGQVLLRRIGTRQVGQTVVSAVPKQERLLGTGLSQRCSSRSSPRLCRREGTSGLSSWKPCSLMRRSGQSLAGIRT